MSNLHIVVNKKWFDLIKAGVKREEYREIKPHWVGRLMMNGHMTNENNPEWVAEMLLGGANEWDDCCYQFRRFKTVTFVCGMPKKGTQDAADKTLVFRFIETEVGHAKEGIGKELVGDQLVFVIKFEDFEPSISD